MKRGPRRVRRSLLLLWAPCLGRSQEPPPAPVFPARADLVLLDLVVRDKAGRLVDDLRADEVQVREDGKPCAVRSFRLVQAEGGGHGRVPATGPVACRRRSRRPRPRDPPPTGDGLVSVVALVFDQLGPEAARNARAAALQLADRSFPKGSVFAVFKVGQGLADSAVVHRGPRAPARGDREGDDGHRPGPRPGAARGVRQRHGGGLLAGPRGASRREEQGAGRAVQGDGSPDAPLHRFRDAGGPGPGLAPAAPRDRARAVARPGPEVAPLLLGGPRRPAERSRTSSRRR